MKKYIFITFLNFLLITSLQANHDTFEYDFVYFKKFEVKGSQDYHKFKKDLISDKIILEEIKDSKKSGLISYLLFEDNKIKIDESALPIYIKENNGLLLSNSVGKSLVSYVTGHAICEGYIENVDVVLDDWSILDGTIYEGQKLIDLLNMNAGDHKYIGMRNFSTDNMLEVIKNFGLNVNTLPLGDILKMEVIQDAKKSKKYFNYNALVTNIIMNYTIFKTGDDWQKLLNKVFNEHVKVKNNVYFHQTVVPSHDGTNASGRYSFYANRYDYLRIIKTMVDDWNNDTCVGKYLKIINKNSIKKKLKEYKPTIIDSYSKNYGGQFHLNFVGMKNRNIFGLSGYGGQQILIDMDKQKILIVHATQSHYNWKKLVYEKIK